MSNCSCKPFCEDHGREFIQVDVYDYGGEFCSACAEDGFTGELCWPASDSCCLSSPASNAWERQFMCWWHALKHRWFCWRMKHG